MPATTPDEALEAFFDAFNQCDIEKMMALYEPRPVMVAQPGQVAEGQAAVREALKLFLAMKPTMTRRDHTAVIAGDLALLIVKWSMKGTGPDGQPVLMEGTSTDVARKQSDGRWLFVIDNPWGISVLS